VPLLAEDQPEESLEEDLEVDLSTRGRHFLTLHTLSSLVLLFPALLFVSIIVQVILINKGILVSTNLTKTIVK